jgi:hypothetical protein
MPWLLGSVAQQGKKKKMDKDKERDKTSPHKTHPVLLMPS